MLSEYFAVSYIDTDTIVLNHFSVKHIYLFCLKHEFECHFRINLYLGPTYLLLIFFANLWVFMHTQ